MTVSTSSAIPDHTAPARPRRSSIMTATSPAASYSTKGAPSAGRDSACGPQGRSPPASATSMRPRSLTRAAGCCMATPAEGSRKARRSLTHADFRFSPVPYPRTCAFPVATASSGTDVVCVSGACTFRPMPPMKSLKLLQWLLTLLARFSTSNRSDAATGNAFGADRLRLTVVMSHNGQQMAHALMDSLTIQPIPFGLRFARGRRCYERRILP